MRAKNDEVSTDEKASTRKVLAPCTGEGQEFAELRVAIQELMPRLKEEAANSWGAHSARGESASDFYQEALAIALQKAGQFRGASHVALYAWLRGILLNELRQSYRRNRREKRNCNREEWVPHIEHFSVQEPTPSRIVQAREECQQLNGYISELTGEQQLVLHLRVIEKLSHEEIGRRISKSAEAARKIYLRVALRLEARINKSDETTPT
jgi:RNA polymerase sigma factor (sigma-70 family)